MPTAMTSMAALINNAAQDLEHPWQSMDLI
jgi:hypothetical protein